MDKFPGPVNADKKSEAEQRRRALKDRFRKVSRGIDRGRFGAIGSDTHADRTFSPFEIGIAVVGALFVVWVAASLLGVG